MTTSTGGFDKSLEMERQIYKPPAKVSFQKPLSRTRAPVNPVKPQACPAPFVKPVNPRLSVNPAIVNTVSPQSSVHQAKTIQPDVQRVRTATVKPTYLKATLAQPVVAQANTLHLSDNPPPRSDDSPQANGYAESQLQQPSETRTIETEDMSYQHSDRHIPPPSMIASEDEDPSEVPVFRHPPPKLSDKSAPTLPDSSMTRNSGSIQHHPPEKGNSSQALVTNFIRCKKS